MRRQQCVCVFKCMRVGGWWWWANKCDGADDDDDIVQHFDHWSGNIMSYRRPGEQIYTRTRLSWAHAE